MYYAITTDFCSSIVHLMLNERMLLTTLGQRLRKQRHHKNYTQHDLAQQAGVSNRFLTQLENGTGNISVLRLANVCAALELPLSELFQGIGPNGVSIITLVGMRGAGKSTVGSALSARMGLRFVELNDLVTADAALSLPEIFEMGGLEYYHDLVDTTLRRLLRNPTPMILSAGGSIVCHSQNWSWLRAQSLTVWLQAKPETHLNRVRNQGDFRPMEGRQNALQELRQILSDRQPMYAEAELHLNTDGSSVEQLVDLILSYREGSG